MARRRIIELEEDEELRIQIGKALQKLLPGKQLTIANERIRAIWPIQDEETLRRLHNTNDVNKLSALFASAYDCTRSFAHNGDLIFIKK